VLQVGCCGSTRIDRVIIATMTMTPDELDTRNVVTIYSAYSGCYDLLFGRIFHRSRAEAIRLLELKPGDRVLEVGVGTGLSLSLYPGHCRVIGIDLTGKMLERGARRVNEEGLHHVHLQQQDAAAMAFHNDSFDAVLAAYVISTVPDSKAVLAEMSRVCRPGGVIVLLNHFSAASRWLSGIERRLSPLCRRFGFRSDLCLETLLQESYLAVRHTCRVNPLHYWQLIQCVNQKPKHGFAC
jgi:phosphatidylethanolamine/phosphatidyl-N-methylethanolamine N-methyltransferase